MATKKDLVEAYSFSRRRLITAFVSGAPGGREVEPNRPGRTIVGGIALAILLVAGAAVLGILKSPTVVDFESEDLVSEKELGTDYVVLPNSEGVIELRPVANITSAMLLFGADVDSREVPREELAELQIGAPIGILEAPAQPPETSALVQDRWTACTGVDGGEPLGVKLDLSTEPQVRTTPTVGFVVRSEGELFVVAEAEVRDERPTPRAFAYPVPGNETAADGVLLNAANTAALNAIDVPRSWLELFPEGGALALGSFDLTREQLRTAPDPAVRGVPADARVGDVLVDGEDRYLLLPDGVVVLRPFADQVYRSLAFPRKLRPREVAATQTPGPAIEPARTMTWPAEPTAENTSGEICGLLETEADLQPDVLLATPSGVDASAQEVRAGEDTATVEPGHGALVVSGDFDSAGTGTYTLVDSRAYRYSLAGATERDRLGYSGEDKIVVPDSWLSLLNDGVPLSVDAASCPPTSQAQSEPCGGGP